MIPNTWREFHDIFISEMRNVKSIGDMYDTRFLKILCEMDNITNQKDIESKAEVWFSFLNAFVSLDDALIRNRDEYKAS